jgi:hypothetical protein
MLRDIDEIARQQACLHWYSGPGSVLINLRFNVYTRDY